MPLSDTALIWVPRDALTGDALTTSPVCLDDAVKLQKEKPFGQVRLDTVAGGGSPDWVYPVDDTTELVHRLLESNHA